MANDNQAPPAKPIQERFTIALGELIGMCIEAGMSPLEMIEPMEKELAWLRRPFEDPKDN